MSSVVDGDGLRHVLMCRVALGRTEEVVRGSGQSRPSSKHFHSGIDILKNPTRYVVWYHDVPTRVLPLYVLSFKVDFRNRGEVHCQNSISICASVTFFISQISFRVVLNCRITAERAYQGSFVTMDIHYTPSPCAIEIFAPSHHVPDQEISLRVQSTNLLLMLNISYSEVLCFIKLCIY